MCVALELGLREKRERQRAALISEGGKATQADNIVSIIVCWGWGGGKEPWKTLRLWLFVISDSLAIYLYSAFLFVCVCVLSSNQFCATECPVETQHCGCDTIFTPLLLLFLFYTPLCWCLPTVKWGFFCNSPVFFFILSLLQPPPPPIHTHTHLL